MSPGLRLSTSSSSLVDQPGLASPTKLRGTDISAKLVSPPSGSSPVMSTPSLSLPANNATTSTATATSSTAASQSLPIAVSSGTFDTTKPLAGSRVSSTPVPDTDKDSRQEISDLTTTPKISASRGQTGEDKENQTAAGHNPKETIDANTEATSKERLAGPSVTTSPTIPSAAASSHTSSSVEDGQ